MRVARPQPADLLVGAGALLLLAAFLPWYGLDTGIFVTDGGSGGTSVTAWEASPAWWGPVLAGVVVAGLGLLRRTGRLTADWLPGVVVAVSLLGLLLVVAQLVTGIPELSDFGWFAYTPSAQPPLSAGPRFGVLVALVAICAQLVAGFLLVRRRPA